MKRMRVKNNEFASVGAKETGTQIVRSSEVSLRRYRRSTSFLAVLAVSEKVPISEKNVSCHLLNHDVLNYLGDIRQWLNWLTPDPSHQFLSSPRPLVAFVSRCAHIWVSVTTDINVLQS